MSRVIPFRGLLTETQFARALEFQAANSASLLRDELILTLAALAGLRAHEITAVSLATLIDQGGSVAEEIVLPKHVAKYRAVRVLPMPGRVREALIRFRTAFPAIERIGDLFEVGATKAVRHLLAAAYTEIGYLDCRAAIPLVVSRQLARPAGSAAQPPRSPEPRAGKAGAIRNADVVRAVKAVERAGLTIASTEIRHDGTIKFTHAPAQENPNTAYEKWKERRDARST